MVPGFFGYPRTVISYHIFMFASLASLAMTYSDYKTAPVVMFDIVADQVAENLVDLCGIGPDAAELVIELYLDTVLFYGL